MTAEIPEGQPERMRAPEQEWRGPTAGVARTLLGTAEPRLYDLTKRVESQDHDRLRGRLAARDHVNVHPLLRVFTRRSMGIGQEAEEAGVVRWERRAERWLREQSDSEAGQVLRELTGEREAVREFRERYLSFGDSRDEGERVREIEGRGRALLTEVVDGCREGAGGTVDMTKLRRRVIALTPLLREYGDIYGEGDSYGDGMVYALIGEGMLQQPGERKREMVEMVLQASGAEVRKASDRDMFAELERFSGPMEYQASSVPGIRLKGAATIEEGGYHYNEDSFFTPYGEYLPDQKYKNPEGRLLAATHEQGLSRTDEWNQAQFLALYLQNTSAGLSSEAIYTLRDRVKDFIADGKLQGLATLSDGMGGHAAGDTASSLAQVLFNDFVVTHIDRESDKQALLKKALIHTNNMLVEVQQSNPRLAGMGATFVGALTDAEGETFTVSIGDSRIYRRNKKTNAVSLLTADTSMVWNRLGEGESRFPLFDLFANKQRSLLLHGLGAEVAGFENAIQTARDIWLSKDEQLHLVCDGVWEIGNPYTGRLDPTASIHRIDRQLRRDLETMNPEEAKKKAMAELYKQVNLAGLTNEASLAQHLTREEIQDASHDNVTALIYEPSGEDGFSSGIAKALLRTLGSRYGDEGFSRSRVLRRLSRQTEVNVAVGGEASGDRRGIQSVLRSEERRVFIGEMIAMSRDENGINLVTLFENLKDRMPQIHDPAVRYLTMAQAILEQPIQEKRRMLEVVMSAAEGQLTDQELLERLTRHADEKPGRGKVLARRAVLAAIGGTAAGFAADRLIFSGSTPHPESATPGENEPINERFNNPFAEIEANKQAKRFGITAGNFWEIDSEVMRKIGKSGAFLAEKDILPIFPPAVYDQRAALEWAAADSEFVMPTNVPVNVLATVATIESAGDLTANSGEAGAQGLMQVVPGYHLDQIIQVAQALSGKVINGVPIQKFDVSDAAAHLSEWNTLVKTGGNYVSFGNGFGDVAKALENPFVASKVAALILQQNYQIATDDLGKEDPPDNSPVDGWVLAMGEYNGGQGIASDALTPSKEPDQTQLYQRYAQRFIMTAEIAAQLRNLGMRDSVIARALISQEINARAYAYNTVADSALMPNEMTMADYHSLWTPLSQVSIPSNTPIDEALRQAYLQYSPSDYKEPISPGLRLWIAQGGYNLFEASPHNSVQSLYPANQR